MDWTAILKKGNVPEPLGRPEVIKDIESNPYVKKKGKPKVKAKGTKRRSSGRK